MAIYLDHAATTPVHPRVVEAMLPYLQDHFGNPSSIHRFGRQARLAIDRARETVASALGAEPHEIVFTSGGTEADNLALIGAAYANRKKGRHIITTQVEHHAVLHTCQHLESMGFRVTYLPVDETGKVSAQAVKEAISEETILISVMYGNNEVGTIQPVTEIGEIARERGIVFHTDAVQAFGIVPLDVEALGVDLLSVSAHKINGPKGIGALYVSQKIRISPHIHGGSQERNRRAGTENVAAIVGFTEAVRIALEEMETRREKYRAFRELMLEVWRREGVPFVVNGHPEDHLPHILNVSFPGTETETMLMNLDIAGIAAASGSACSSGSLELSHVLRAMCLQEETMKSAIRFSFGLGNTAEEVKEAARKAGQIAKKIAEKRGKTWEKVR
ncbi:cysteine desulfurase family protein [Bacillaceae bacterium]